MRAGPMKLVCPCCLARLSVRTKGGAAPPPPTLTAEDVRRLVEELRPPEPEPVADPDPLPQPAIPDGWEVVVEREAVRGEGGVLAGTTERRRLVRANGQGGPAPGWVEVVERQAVRGPDGQLTGTTERRRCVREGDGNEKETAQRDGLLSPLRTRADNSGEGRGINAVADAGARDAAADDGGSTAGS